MTPHGLKSWRKKYGLTQSEAADKLGIRVSDIVNYERNDKPRQRETLTAGNEIERACRSFDRKQKIKAKIKEKIVNGPPGHITPEVLQEILLEIVDTT